MTPPKTSQVIWYFFEEVEPPAIYLKGEYDSKVPYFVALAGNQIIPLIWHAHQGQLSRWETFDGKGFPGEVLWWCTQPILQ